MESKIMYKVFKNELKSIFGREKYDMLERAKLIDNYFRLCKENNISVRQVTRELGVDRSTLYRTRSLLKIPESHIMQLRNSGLEYEQIARILCNTKTKKEQDEVFKRSIAEKMTGKESCSLIAEIHDPQKVAKHFNRILLSFDRELQKFENKLHPDIDFSRVILKIESIESKLTELKIKIEGLK